MKPIKQVYKRAVAFGLMTLVLSAGLLQGCDYKPKFTNTDITGSALTAPFQLKDLSGEVRTLDSYKGKVVAMFFGYTHCPDVCPVTMQQWSQIRQALGDEGKDLQVIFVSVDPKRDTPELLRNYVPKFDSSFQALTGTEEELQPLLKGLRVFSQKVDGKVEGQYLMDHSTTSYVFDKTGALRLLVRHNADIEPVVKDVKQLL